MVVYFDVLLVSLAVACVNWAMQRMMNEERRLTRVAQWECDKLVSRGTRRWRGRICQ